MVFLSLPLTALVQQGAAEAAGSGERERVSASLWLQTSESVQVFCFFSFERVLGEQSGSGKV